MSTRGVIARRAGDGFRGSFHHWDSYPAGLGATLFQLYNGFFERDLEKMLAYLIDEHPSGWSTINKCEFSLPPGYVDDQSGPCAECGKDVWEHYYQYYQEHGAMTPAIEKKIAASQYTALGHSWKWTRRPKGPQCHCHSEGGIRNQDAKPEEYTEKNAAGSGVEWVYAFFEEGGHSRMAILSSYNGDGRKMIGFFGQGNSEAAWRPAAIVDLDGPSPDWEEIGKVEEAKA